MEPFDLFEDEITTEEELRSVVGFPHEAVVQKSVAVIDDQIRRYIAMSPLFFLSTSHADGSCDVSPRGDVPGFVRVWDEKHLVFPERQGNRRADSLLNLLTNPHAGMVFLIPGMEEVLRINGRARIIRSAKVLSGMQSGNQTPQLGVVVEVQECYIHCSRALKSSAVWNSGTWPRPEELPSSKEMFHAHLKINGYKLT
ncbi:pyridoxamine 5'-phosphate oxidase-like FMN-binding protein [Paenibacillus mucilaginosus 3016]|uniref:Pyridoxamine 5'-phosphate oxidase-like FMN-binding protein n=1 Tax=Paenibacillus mucilaginosus 3016 TaxID=1116391 RepID=H6NJF2_9BACL|nr:MSMEG_1061 family FMN-dependent PPOX-type flavoprotein [Paenibacillus mucilaginosus]AFC29231.1 pyridoxamine 5'-phosphate oxidase-like FMN-binding protein [Paenibacillus mucilaginosus 3016]WFA17958.1 pyridoxamine 5'-phosphate oxidase family protein [Paenibacillus mucilaginosus]